MKNRIAKYLYPIPRKVAGKLGLDGQQDDTGVPSFSVTAWCTCGIEHTYEIPLTLVDSPAKLLSFIYRLVVVIPVSNLQIVELIEVIAESAGWNPAQPEGHP
jgi:hypothetical protein